MPTRNSNQERTAGIYAVSDPRDWLVRPWPVHASFHDIVRHFMFADFHSRGTDNSQADNRAFYEVYEKALHGAPAPALTDAWSKRWYNELLDCVMRCVVQFGGTSLLRSEGDPQATEDQHVKAVKQRTDTP
jgi:hypothetical protein